jgi:GNAT superfamily N-acetyltransferase
MATSKAGRLNDVITYLEMTARPTRPPLPVPAGKLALIRLEHCTTSYYRYLYQAVGERWLWFERRVWSDEHLAQVIDKPEIEISVLYVGGVPAGYFELDRGKENEVELCYFGLVFDFIGRGYGNFLLNAAVESAWQRNPGRVWVHTCTYDHPRALGVYQRAGFSVYKRNPITFPDPRLTGALPRSIRHPLLPPLPAP